MYCSYCTYHIEKSRIGAGRPGASERATIMMGAYGGGVVNEVGHAHYMRERIKNHEVNSDTYSIIITASSLVLGYAT